MKKKKSTIGKQQDALENYLVYGIHVTNRRLYFGAVSSSEGEPGDQSDFGHASVSIAIRTIDLLVEMSSEPIEIHMTSYGGDPYFMLALKDKILESPVKFKFFGRGRIASAATWIMAVCDERYLAEDTIVMIHNGSTYYSNYTDKVPMTDATILADHDENLQDRLNQLFSDNSRMPKEFYDMIVKRDCYMTAKETIMLGLADEIIPHRHRASLRKKRMESLNNKPKAHHLQMLVNRLVKRTRQDNAQLKFTLNIAKDKLEELPEYDNTEEALTKLGVEEAPTEESSS